MAYIRCGSGGAEKPTLVWTNPSSLTSNWDAQTVYMDLSQYDALLIELIDYFPIHKHYYNYIDRMIPSDNINYSISCPYNNTYYATRMLTIYDDRIVFSHGALNGSADSAFAIPIKIYGIKKPLI